MAEGNFSVWQLQHFKHQAMYRGMGKFGLKKCCGWDIEATQRGREGDSRALDYLSQARGQLQEKIRPVAQHLGIFSCNWLLTSIYKHQAFRHANEQWVLEWLFRDLLHLSLNSPSLFSAYDISSILVTTCEAYLNTSRLLRIPRYPPPFLRMPLNKSPPHFHPPYCHVWLPQRISIQQIESAKAASFSWAMTTDKTCDDFLTGRPAFSRDIYTRSLNSARVRDAEGQAGMPIHCAGSPSSWNKELG